MKLKKPKKEEIKILVVDDETIVALDIKNTLEKYGYKVVGIASSSQEAIKLVKSSKPNLILMDIMIKGSKDGIETAQEINEFADIPIIFLTAYSDDSTLERAKLVEPYGYLIKPFDNRELFTTIEMSIYKHSMEISIRESEESLSITLNSIGDAVISTNDKGLIERMNPVAEELTGWTIEESKGKPLDKIFYLIDATTREPITNPVKKVIESGEVIGLSNHTILIAKDGTERNISDSAAPIKDNEGNIRGVVLVFSDVTESYNSRKQLKESEEKFRQLVTTMEQGLAVHEVIYDKKGKVVDYRFLDINDSFTKLTGLTKKNVIGKTVLEIMPDTEKYWIERYGEVAVTGNATEFENYSNELGKYYHVVAFQNRPNQFAVIITDVTDRKIAEEELIIKEQAMASSINAIALADLNGNLTYVNKSFLQLWGYKNEKDVLGKSALIFWEKPDDAGKVLKSVLEKGSFVGELKAIRKNKQLLDLNLSTTLVYGSEGKPVQIMASFIDITERKKAEERIHLMANLLNLSPASVIVHDIEGKILFANKRTLEMHGYSEEEFTKLTLRDIDTPESAQLIEERINKIKKDGELSFEVSHFRKDGSSFPLLVNTKITKWNNQDVLLSVSNDITEKKLQEEILHQKTEELDNYFSNALDLFCIANTDGYFIRLNKQWESVLGYSLDELEEKNFLDFIHPEDMKATLEAISVLSDQKKLIGFTNRYRAKDGSYKYIEWRSYPSGERIYAAARDITERKLAEEALKQSEEMFRSYVESAPEAIMVVDEKGNYVMVNKASCDMTGYSRDELLKMHIMDVTYPGDFEKGKRHFKNVVEKGEAIDEVRFVNKSGEVRYWSVKAVKLSDTRFLGFQSDITKKKLAELALKESEERYSLVVEASEQGIWDWNVSTNQVYFSPQWKKQIGYVDEEIKNDFNEWIEHLHNDDKERCLNAVQEYLKNPEKHFILEFRFRHKDGSYRWIHNKAASILNKEGKVVRMFGAHMDITERKLAEEALKESEERYKTFIESTDDMAFVKDENLRYVMVNNVLAGVFGKKKEEVEGKTDYELMTKEGADDCKSSDLRAINEGQLIISEEVSSGRILETRKFPVHFKNGKIGVGGYIRDITEQKKSQEAIHLSEVKFNRAFHASPVAMSIQDYHDIFRDVNDAFLQLTGYSREEIIGHTGNELKLWANSEQRKQVNEQFEKHEAVRNFEFQFKRKNGSTGFGILSAELISINGKDAALTAVLDITDRQNALEALKKSEFFLRKSQQVSRTGSYLYDIKKSIWICSEALDDIFGIDENFEKSTEGWIEIIHPDYKQMMTDHLLKHVIEGKNRFDKEYKIIRVVDGKELWVNGIGELEFDKDGNPVTMVGTIQDITERKLAEAKLKESEDRFSRAIAGTGAGLWDWDMINNKVYFSPQWKSMLGYNDNEVENDFSGWKNLWHPEDALMIENTVNDYLQMKTAQYEVVHRLRHKDGSWHWILTRGHIHRDTDGTPIRWVGTNIDITERKKVEDALIESERKFKTLFDSMPNGYYLTTPDGYFVDANPAFIKMLGYESLDELKSLHIPTDVYVKSSERDEILNNNVEFVSNLETYRLKRKDGKIIWIEDNARYILDENQKVLYHEGICKDITDRKNAADALRESEQLFNTLAQVSPVGIFRTRPDGYTTYVNPKWVRLSGIPADKAMGDGWLNALHPEDREKIKAGWDSTTGKHDVSVAEYRFLRPNGTIVWVMGQAIPEFDASNNIVGYVGTITDITERKQAEDALRESEERFRAITEQTTSLISLTDEEGMITYASPAARMIFKCDPLDMIGHPFIEFLVESYIPIAVDVFTKATSGIENTKNIELKMKRLDGSVFFGELNGSRFEWGGKTGSLVVIQDITERKNAEAAIKESEERLRILAEKTGTIVYDRDLISNVIHRDGAIEEVLGYSKEEYNKFTIEDFAVLLHPDDRDKVFSDEEKVFKTGGNITQIYRLKHKNGNYVYIEDNGIVLVDENGTGIRMLGSMKDITERKLSENALKESEERLRILAEKTGTIVYDRNLVTKKIHREGAIEEVLGYSRDELNSFNNAQLNELIDEKEKTEYFQNIKNILEKPGSFSINYKLKHKNGSFIFIEDNGIVLTDDNGMPNRVLGSMKDITLKKHAENELRKLSHAVEQSQVSIVITNREGTIEYVNPKFCEVTGYNFDEAIGQNPRILKSGEWQSDAYHGMWDDISSGRSWTGIFHNKRKNGELFWESAHISPIKDLYGEITHYIAVKEDITEKVKNEEQLTKYREHLEEMVEERTAQLNSQNNFLRSLIDTIPNPLFVKDSEGCYTDVNPAFEKFFDVKKDEIIGKKLDIILSGENRKIAIDTDEQLKRARGFIAYELTLDRNDNKKVPVIVYKSSFGISASEPEGIMGMFIDISERKEMEEKTIEALNREKELNEMKTNFISMASHEFRTPLTTILASADLVEMYYKKWPEDKVINHIKKIQDSVTYMTSLLDDVLTLSRADRGKIKFSPTKVNLKDLCSQLMNEIQYQTLPGHNLIFDYKPDEEIFTLDNKLLTQILNNLLSNAVKFSPDGGKILLSVTKKKEKIQFIVEDEGLGIEPNDLKNIFEPFYRGKNVTEIHGSGLGLNIVKNAVELCGGEISIESEVNKGTKITFTIRTK